MVQYTNRAYICIVFTPQFTEACQVSMKFIYNIVRVVAANAKAAAARAKLAIAEQISNFSRKVGNGRPVGDNAIRQARPRKKVVARWCLESSQTTERELNI